MTKAIAHLVDTFITQARPTDFEITVRYTLYSDTWDYETGTAPKEDVVVYVPNTSRPRDIDTAVEDAIIEHVVAHYSLVLDRRDLVYHSGFQRG